jgi:hypothetical protein
VEILRRLKREIVRRGTYRNWSSAVISPGELARAGFFYFNDGDRVQCAFCLGIIERWAPRDNAMSEHRRLFGNCPFICGLPVGNIPIDPITGREVIPPESPLNLTGGIDATGRAPAPQVRPTAEPEKGQFKIGLIVARYRDSY